MTDDFNVVLGAQNIFDEYPDPLTDYTFQCGNETCNYAEDVAGAKYPVTSPYGFNGGYYYLKASYSF